jgi:ribosomal protein S18 acetylase RimI-like enzyme
MSSSPSRAHALTLLERDPLRHIVGLKMLHHVGTAADVSLREDDAGWALLITFPSSAFEYDAKNYGHDTRIAVLKGTSEPSQLDLLEALDAREARHTVLKTQNSKVARRARERFDARPVAAFVSFTADGHAAPHSDAPPNTRFEASTSTALTPTLVTLFERNGYTRAELERYFAAGSRWFSLEQNSTLAAACFVFQNFGRVWEIAGVHTDPGHRRRGLGARVVEAALRHLLAARALPRYQTAATNEASLALARSIGLVEFLRIEHLEIVPRAA